MTERVARVLHFVRRNGFRATLARISAGLRRLPYGRRMVIFYCEPGKLPARTHSLPENVSIVMRTSESSLTPDELALLIGSGEPEATRKRIHERFEKRALLRVVKYGGQCAAFGWTLRGQTMEPHYFPVGPDDVHFFDFYVHPQFRGQRLNKVLMDAVLADLQDGKTRRALLEAAEWNKPQLTSLSRTPFVRSGRAVKSGGGPRPAVRWLEGGPPPEST